MNRIPALRFFEFGRLISNYQAITPNVTNYNLYNATVNIKDYFLEFNLSESQRHLEKLSPFSSLFDKIDKVSKKKPKITANKNLLLELKKEVKKIEEIVQKELSEKLVAYPNSIKLEIKHLILEPSL